MPGRIYQPRCFGGMTGKVCSAASRNAGARSLGSVDMATQRASPTGPEPQTGATLSRTLALHAARCSTATSVYEYLDAGFGCGGRRLNLTSTLDNTGQLSLATPRPRSTRDLPDAFAERRLAKRLSIC